MRTGLDRPLDGHDHPAILEAPRRVRALDLELQVETELLGEAGGADERRRALAEREPRGGFHAHPSSVTPRSETTGSSVERRLICGSSAIAASASSSAPVAASCVTTCRAAPSPFACCSEAGDRDLAQRELLGDPRQRARPVLDRQAEVVRRARLARRQPLELAPRGVVLQEAGSHRPDHRRDVGDHRRGGLRAAGAGALERDLADCVALQHHRVERAVDLRERMLLVDERGPDPNVVVTVDEPGRTDEADHHLELARRRNVDRIDLGDPVVLDVVEPHARVERNRREDRHLGRGVRARHVVGRIGLRIAARLRVGERLGVGLAALHLRENEVGGAVDDPEHAVHVRHDHRLAQHLDHRDRCAHRRLEAQLDACRRGSREQLGAAAGDELLVGRDHVLPAREELEHVRAGGLEAAHHLRDDGDLGIVRDLGEVVGKHSARGTVLTLLADVANERLDDAQPVAGGAFDVVCRFRQEPVDRGADRPVAEQGDLGVNRRHEPPRSPRAR